MACFILLNLLWWIIKKIKNREKNGVYEDFQEFIPETKQPLIPYDEVEA